MEAACKTLATQRMKRSGMRWRQAGGQTILTGVEALKETSCSLHAYALRTNHVHLLLTPKNAAAVPKLVISLGRRYVQYITVSTRRTGTLWDSR